MGSPWKMPNNDQLNELRTKTNNTWTTLNGVNGYKFTSNRDSTKYIFLPATGAYGHYWSTQMSGSKGWCLFFESYRITSSTFAKYLGFPVRAIQ